MIPERKKNPVSDVSLDENALLTAEVRKEMARVVRADTKAEVTHFTSPLQAENTQLLSAKGRNLRL